jgi:hypothetical protein
MGSAYLRQLPRPSHSSLPHFLTYTPPLSPSAHAVEGLRSAKWQERMEAIESITSKVSALSPSELDATASHAIQALAFLPGWAEKNVQV